MSHWTARTWGQKSRSLGIWGTQTCRQSWKSTTLEVKTKDQSIGRLFLSKIQESWLQGPRNDANRRADPTLARSRGLNECPSKTARKHWKTKLIQGIKAKSPLKISESESTALKKKRLHSKVCLTVTRDSSRCSPLISEVVEVPVPPEGSQRTTRDSRARTVDCLRQVSACSCTPLRSRAEKRW